MDDRAEERKAYIQQYQRERSALMRRLKLCRRCKQQDAFTLAGRVMCAECAEKHNAGRRARRQEKHDAAVAAERQVHRGIYARRRGQGQCVRCGKPSDGKSMCPACRIRNNEKRRTQNHRAGVMPMELRGKDGGCFFCITEPAAEGYKVCEACLERIRRMAREREQRDMSGHVWHRDNRMVFWNT